MVPERKVKFTVAGDVVGVGCGQVGVSRSPSDHQDAPQSSLPMSVHL